MEYLVEAQGIEIRWNCAYFLQLPGCVPYCPNDCHPNCEAFCGGQVCSPRMDPMSLN